MCLNVLTDMMKHNNYLLHLMLKSRDAVGFESRLIFWSFKLCAHPARPWHCDGGCWDVLM